MVIPDQEETYTMSSFILSLSFQSFISVIDHVVSSVPLDFEASKGAIPTNSILQTSRCRQRLHVACFPVFQEPQSP